MAKKRRRYGSYYWIDKKTNLGYCKVQIPTSETYPNGKLKYKTVKKRALNATHAQQIAEELLSDFGERKKGYLEGMQMAFLELADWYKENYSVPPVYAEDGTKIKGKRTWQNERRKIDNMSKFFGKILINEIDEDVLMKYKLRREILKLQPATIHRDLEILRTMFAKAVRRRWLKENPFNFGENLIIKSREKRRDVVLSETEENILLNYARRSDKSNIYYAILCLLDTGARPSEIYDASTEKAEPVKWRDFTDYDFKAVKLTSYKGKQKLVRFAPISERLETAMREVWEESDKDYDAQIFNQKSYKTAWRTLLKNIQANHDGETWHDLRMRDLRRNFSTRLANLGIENDLRQRLLGHEQAQTTFDYTTANLETALKVREKLENIIIIDGEN